MYAFCKMEFMKIKLPLNLWLLIAILASSKTWAQAPSHQDSLTKQIAQFENSLANNFKKEFLNIAQRDLGGISETDYAWKEAFLMEAKDKKEDNLGSRKRFKYYFTIYGYQTVKDRQYALKYWLDNFIERETLRPGRDKRTLRYATPAIILINPKSIVVCNYDCRYYFYDDFDQWKERLLEQFESDQTMVIEVLCDGPVKWTKRAPDPKSRGLF
jgi:hypothetical protein